MRPGTAGFTASGLARPSIPIQSAALSLRRSPELKASITSGARTTEGPGYFFANSVKRTIEW